MQKSAVNQILNAKSTKFNARLVEDYALVTPTNEIFKDRAIMRVKNMGILLLDKYGDVYDSFELPYGITLVAYVEALIVREEYKKQH
jgi:hypothetical protein